MSWPQWLTSNKWTEVMSVSLPVSSWLFSCWDASLETQPPCCEEAQLTWRGPASVHVERPTWEARSGGSQATASTNRQPSFWVFKLRPKHQAQRQATSTVSGPSACFTESMSKINACFMPLSFSYPLRVLYSAAIVTGIVINKDRFRGVPQRHPIGMEKRRKPGSEIVLFF